MSQAPLSPVTGKPMVRGVRPMTFRYKGETVTVEMPGWYCEDSDESLHVGKDMEVSDRALQIMKIRADGLLPPEEIRRIRKRLGLTQRDAGEVIGGGPNAFQKYESGEVLVSRAVSNFLRVLERHPEEVSALRGDREKRRMAAAGASARRDARRPQALPKSPASSRRSGPAKSSRSKA